MRHFLGYPVRAGASNYPDGARLLKAWSVDAGRNRQNRIDMGWIDEVRFAGLVEWDCGRRCGAELV